MEKAGEIGEEEQIQDYTKYNAIRQDWQKLRYESQRNMLTLRKTIFILSKQMKEAMVVHVFVSLDNKVI